MDKIKLSDIRSQFPMYGDMNDEQLLIGLRKKYYSDIPMGRFVDRIEFDTQRINPTEDMSTTDLVLAGVGKSFADLGRAGKRVANMVGVGDYDQKAAQSDADLDKALMDTRAGTVGKFAGDVALTAIPGYRAQQAATRGIQAASAMRALPKAVQAVGRGVAPYAGAVASGAAVGAALTPEDMSGGATTGALAGGAGELGGRVLSAGYGGAKAVLEPLWQGGRERILKRTMERFAADPSAVRAAAAAPRELVPGVMPTLAEATMDPGIAQLQRGAAASSSDVASALAEARNRQVAGYRGALDDLAGNDGRRDFFDAARRTTADQLYGQARAGGLQMDAALQSQAAALMQKPSIKSAINKAKGLARERGQRIDNPAGSVAGLMNVDDVIGDQIGAALRSGNDKLASALRGTQEELRAFLDQAAPSYGDARRTYQAMSRPINQMDIGQRLRDTALPALGDLGGSMSRVNANSYATALRNADQTAARATGLRSATMANVLEPQQMASVQGIGEDMARYASAQELARVPGSPTAQYMGAQNVIRQFLGPLGIPQSAADSMAGRVISGVLSLPFKLTESQTEQLLARALTDPRTAARLMNTSDPRTIADALRPYAAQLAIQIDTQ